MIWNYGEYLQEGPLGLFSFPTTMTKHSFAFCHEGLQMEFFGPQPDLIPISIISIVQIYFVCLVGLVG